MEIRAQLFTQHAVLNQELSMPRRQLMILLQLCDQDCQRFFWCKAQTTTDAHNSINRKMRWIASMDTPSSMCGNVHKPTVCL